ncbi:MAG: serine/threonine-protein kinase, partial [Planctomycetes bacterium]|nr:serine/threonine-protein kinase [Planctomycetota bacterium]
FESVDSDKSSRAADFSPRETSEIDGASTPESSRRLKPAAQGGLHYLVMELVEGETLSQRLTKGPVSLDQVLQYGSEIASALEAAHRAGVIHRDLKPGNIMLARSGAKLLDFGLAKHVQTGSGLSSDPEAPTLTEPLTGKGTILGTFQYMAPEQLEGKEADARTDVFAFGAVLYEMATGRRAFSGKSRASLIASIMSAKPQPISELQPMAPPALDHLIRLCLAKDPDERIQTAHDVKLQLQWIAQGGSQVGLPTPVLLKRKSRERLAWSLAAILFVATAFFSFSYLKTMRRTPAVVRAEITSPEGVEFDFSGVTAGPVVISPDGTKIAFGARSENSDNTLWVRSLDDRLARELPGTDGVIRPFWSADSRSIGFFAQGKLKRVDASGGPPLTLCDAPGGRGGTWNRDDVILFAPRFQAPIHRVPASGGAATPITQVDESKHSSHRWPYFLPDGKHFLYLAINHNTVLKEREAIYVASLDGQTGELVMRTGSNVAFASGYLLFMRDRTLMARAFDPNSREFLGPAAPVAADVRDDRPSWVSVYSVSQNGTLVYQTGEAGRETTLTWYDRSGEKQGALAQEDFYYGLKLSPDGERLAVAAGEGNADIWIYHLARGMRTRLTFEPIIQLAPIWSPDGKDIVYSSLFTNPKRIFRRSSLGVGEEELLLESDEGIIATDWSFDGKYLLYIKADIVQDQGPSEIRVLPLDKTVEPRPILQTPFFVESAQFSPDGKWVAFSSNESGRSEIYVIPFALPNQADDADAVPVQGGKWQVSVEGGSWPTWGHDGKELFYVSRGRMLMVASVNGKGEDFVVSSVGSLFAMPINPFGRTYDVSPDGQRFIVNVYGGEQNTPISLVLNWTQALEP